MIKLVKTKTKIGVPIFAIMTDKSLPGMRDISDIVDNEEKRRLAGRTVERNPHKPENRRSEGDE